MLMMLIGLSNGNGVGEGTMERAEKSTTYAIMAAIELTLDGTQSLRAP